MPSVAQGNSITFDEFTDGSTTFSIVFFGESSSLPVRVEPSANIGGPDVLVRIQANDAGAIIDLDGTGAASLVPQKLSFTFRFTAANPAAHTQYDNLIALKGKHGTLSGRVYGSSGRTTYTAPARLIEITGNAEGMQYLNKPSYLIATATWQLKDFWSY
jgi:hypothetical protein